MNLRSEGFFFVGLDSGSSPTCEYVSHLYCAGVRPVETERAKNREAGRRAFGQALDEALADARLTKSELARRYAEAFGGEITPSKVSDWTRGESLPENGDPEAIFVVERLLSVPRGSLARHLGFVPVETRGCTVEVAVEEDPLLDEIGRTALLGAYRNLVQLRRSG